MSRQIPHYTSLDSTNRKAFELAADGAGHGEVVVAETQSAGRGRLGKSWQSPAGKGLYFSLIVRPDLSRDDYPKITMTAGLAIAEYLEKKCQKDVFLKWPNDIYMSGKKCCGILAEASLQAQSAACRFAIIGVGLNVLTEFADFPKEIEDNATSLFIETGRKLDMDKLLESICSEVLITIEKLSRDGFADILYQWKARDILRDKWLTWVTNSGEVVAGRSEGPDENGQLLVRDSNGRLHEVISGDISLARGKK